MTGTVLVMILVVTVATLVFTIRIWKYAARESIRKQSIVIPRGKNMAEEEEKKNEIDLNDLISQVTNSIEVNAEESGEEAVQIDEETIKQALKGLKL